MKQCSKCGEDDLTLFYKDRSKAFGVSTYCKKCDNAKSLAAKQRDPTYMSRSSKKWRDDNWETARKSEKTYDLTQAGRASRAIIQKAQTAKRKLDPHWIIANRLRSRIWHALKRGAATKSASTVALLGCSIQELRVHLENQFTAGMSWQNQGDWHIDHKVPCVSFDLTDPEQQKVCFHFSNLQPLWAVDNLSKGSKI